MFLKPIQWAVSEKSRTLSRGGGKKRRGGGREQVENLTAGFKVKAFRPGGFLQCIVECCQVRSKAHGKLQIGRIAVRIELAEGSQRLV